jgi:thiamine biosynthesis protein ThiS
MPAKGTQQEEKRTPSGCVFLFRDPEPGTRDSERKMKIIVNGEVREIEEGTTIAILLQGLDIPQAGTAVAIGDSIVSRDEHDTRPIVEGERVEIIRAIGGG